jgi:hypothetical protein
LNRLAVAESWENGKPVRETLAAAIPLAADHFRYFAGVIRGEEGSITELDKVTVSYPAGAAFGGYKSSGVGRENHKMMLDHYTCRSRVRRTCTSSRARRTTRPRDAMTPNHPPRRRRGCRAALPAAPARQRNAQAAPRRAPRPDGVARTGGTIRIRPHRTAAFNGFAMDGRILA